MKKPKNTKMDERSFSSSVDERKEFVEEQYERLWQGVEEKFDGLRAVGEHDLSRVHLFMRRNFGPDFQDQHLREKYEEHERKKLESGFIMDRKIIKIDEMDPRIATLLTDAIKMREAIATFGPNAKRIVELGSGWGKTLFNLFKFGAPLKAEYWALELTRTGRELTERIGKEIASSMEIKTAAFDYYNADLSYFTETKNTCILTHHSIEQIPNIPVELIERILKVPGFHRCLHLEPCGFQIPSNEWLADPGQEDLMERIDNDNKRFAEKRNQNVDLYPVLQDLEKKGKLKIYSVKKYFTSHLINNATTLIAWGPPA